MSNFSSNFIRIIIDSAPIAAGINEIHDPNAIGNPRIIKTDNRVRDIAIDALSKKSNQALINEVK